MICILFACVCVCAKGAENIVHCATDNVNTTDKNPATGYYVRSLRQDRSKYAFSDDVSERLWAASERLCAAKAATPPQQPHADD